MLGAGHQLLRLNTGELCKGAIGRLIAPDSLRGREHRIAAIAFLIITIVLVAMDHDLIADFPCFDLVADRPNNARGIGTCDMIRRTMSVKRADRLAKARPYAVVIHASRHHENQNLMAVDCGCFNDFHLEGFVRLSVAFAADGPRIHLGWYMPHRRHLAHFIKVFLRCVIDDGCGIDIQSHEASVESAIGLVCPMAVAALRNHSAPAAMYKTATQ